MKFTKKKWKCIFFGLNTDVHFCGSGSSLSKSIRIRIRNAGPNQSSNSHLIFFFQFIQTYFRGGIKQNMPPWVFFVFRKRKIFFNAPSKMEYIEMPRFELLKENWNYLPCVWILYLWYYVINIFLSRICIVKYVYRVISW